MREKPALNLNESLNTIKTFTRTKQYENQIKLFINKYELLDAVWEKLYRSKIKY